MKELELKYGCNPNQTSAKAYCKQQDLPIETLGGNPGYINLLDALNGWQLVKELKEATKMSAAASFKHVSPAGAAIGVLLDQNTKKVYFVDDIEYSQIATAYIRARGADRMSSYGDFIALSDECDEQTARLIASEVSDGIIAPAFSKEALSILKKKQSGHYIILKMDENYVPCEIETKEVFGITLEQRRNQIKITKELLECIPTKNKEIPEEAKRDLMISLIILKYTQSNSVCYVKDGQAIGIGAGQQSRIHCTRLAGNKADQWYLRHHPKVVGLPFIEGIKRYDRDNAIDMYLSSWDSELLKEHVWTSLFTKKPILFSKEEKDVWLKSLTQVSLGSDAFFPFGDNIQRAKQSGVSYIAQTGNSIRDDHVIKVCDEYHIAMVFTGIRLFHH